MKTSGETKICLRERRKKKAALECTVVAHRTTNKTTNTCMKREKRGVTNERKHELNFLLC